MKLYALIFLTLMSTSAFAGDRSFDPRYRNSHEREFRYRSPQAQEYRQMDRNYRDYNRYYGPAPYRPRFQRYEYQRGYNSGYYPLPRDRYEYEPYEPYYEEVYPYPYYGGNDRSAERWETIRQILGMVGQAVQNYRRQEYGPIK
jgi:hypothetical protein